jgi:hypothetical protein
LQKLFHTMPAPRTAQQAFDLFLDKVSEITERLGGMGTFVGDLARSFRSLAELSHRLAFQMGALVGMPRFVRGDVRHLLSDTHERGHAAPLASSAGAAQDAAGGGGYKSFEQRVKELRDFHAEKERLAQESRTKDGAHWEEIKRQRKDETEADARADNDKQRRNDLLWAARKAQGEIKEQDNELVTTADVARAKAAASKKPGAQADFGKDTGAHSAYDPAFENKAQAARKILRDKFGLHDLQFPEHNPNNPAYRALVEDTHRQASSLIQPGFPTALAGSAPTGHSAFPVSLSGSSATAASPVAGAAPGSVAGRFGSALANSFKQNSFVAGFFPKVAPYFNAIAQAAQSLTRAFLGITSVSQGLMEAAAPDLWATFTTSLEMLAAQVGGTLVPFFMELALDVQEAARWFGQLSPEVKACIGAVLKWTLVVVGVTAAVVVLGTAVTLLLTPVGLVMTAFVALAAWADRYLQTQKRNEHKSFEDLENTTDVQAVKRAALAERKDQMEKGLQGGSYMAPLSDKELVNAGEKFRNGQMSGASVEHFKAKDLQESLDEHVKKYGEDKDSGGDHYVAEHSEQIQKHLTQAGVFETSAANVDTWLKAKKNGNKLPADSDAQAKTGVGKLLLALPTFRGAAGYSSIADAYKKTQVAALADDPATAELKKIQAEFLKKLVDNSETTKGTVDNISDLIRRIGGY